MAAVALARSTWLDLEARGASLSITVVGLRAPRVDVRAPGGVAAALRAELAWRSDAMRPQLPSGRTLVAVPGPHERDRCGSCGDPWARGDCPLCSAARVSVLRGAGVLPAATPTGREPSDFDEADAAWRDTLRTTPTGKPYPRTEPSARPLGKTSPYWWSCEQGHDNWGPRTLGCGPCEASRFGFVDLSALKGGAR